MRYTIEEADGSERFLSISAIIDAEKVTHIYRYHKKTLVFVATAWACDNGYNPLKFHDEAPIKNIKTIKEAKQILRKFDQGIVQEISKKNAHELLCP